LVKYTNTFRTLLGALRSALARALPFLTRSENLNDIFNFLQIENVYATSGQPGESQFGLIKKAGYKTVVNLAPISVLENSVVDEEQILKRLGLEYIHIPVDFMNPTEEDFQRFVASIENRKDVWVHCAANMRVSAFTYRYRTQLLDEDDAMAKADLQKIWEPFGVWSEFISR
jgi:protein tyrosine phosphatase (PTP) superfamily phosphohydrolase (DUF442 family)